MTTPGRNDGGSLFTLRPLSGVPGSWHTKRAPAAARERKPNQGRKMADSTTVVPHTSQFKMLCRFKITLLRAFKACPHASLKGTEEFSAFQAKTLPQGFYSFISVVLVTPDEEPQLETSRSTVSLSGR